MSTLRSALDELAVDDLEGLTDRQLLDGVVDLTGDIAALEAQRLRRIGEVDRRLAFRQDGALSTTAWLRHSCGMATGPARGHVRMARGLQQMPVTRSAFAAGELDVGRVRTLVAAHARHGEAYVRDEHTLVESAAALLPRDLRRLVDYWSQALDHREALVDHDARFRRRRLHISRTFGGMVRIDGDLDPEGGEIVLTAVRSLAERSNLVETDKRTPAQVRADALVELCRDHLDHGEIALSGGERPHLTVVADLATLEGRAGRRAEIENGTVLHPEAIRRIACDAGVCRVITDGDSQLLDVGRRSRTIPPGLRKALIIRDRGCTAKGCDRPPRWCDAHHIRHWADGGPTRLDNLRLLCRRHHRMHHEGAALARAP